MSSTVQQGQARGHDVYPTPLWAVHQLLAYGLTDLPAGYWLEPCVGDGAIVQAVEQCRPGQQLWHATDIRAESPTLAARRGVSIHKHSVQDFLTQPIHHTYHVCITNPPFNQAMDFIVKCRQIALHTIMLLRVGFMTTADRNPYFVGDMPDLYVLPNRPSFIKGKTDSADYAWYHWRNDGVPTGTTQVMPAISKEYRKEYA